MPSKEIQLKSDTGEILKIELGSRLRKDDLYGKVTRVVERDGKALERGYLLPDGRLLRRSQLTFASVDAEGTPTDKPKAFWSEDQPAEEIPSSFDQENDFKSVPISKLAEFVASDVYTVKPGDLEVGLYETTFNYRKSFQSRAALLLIREDGIGFLLVGGFKKSAFLGRTVTYEFFDAQDEAEGEADPLDFSMM